MNRLHGKIAVVTGAGKGIGRGIARRFAREGAKVVIAELDVEAGKQVADDLGQLGGEGLFIQTDVSHKADIENMIATAQDAFGGLDILVNNAITTTPDVLLEQKTDDMFDQTMRVALWSVWWGMQTALPVMKSRGGGRIINFYSIDADDGNWVHGDYNAAKGAVQALTRTAGIQWARHNILVNAIAPIAASAAYDRMIAENPALAEVIPQMIPCGRIGDPEDDIAPVAAFLASDDSRFITGATIPVDGGLHVPRVNTRPPDLSIFNSIPGSAGTEEVRSSET
jgi:NAD(P)-dependent dehydrogenase (short-subunit alcohol dehydrogenase family)